MTPIPLRPGTCVLAAPCLAVAPARAQSLLDLFAAARSFDAGYRSAPLHLAEQERTIRVGQACFGVLSRQGQAGALEAAEASSQSALEANKVGYQMGVRINSTLTPQDLQAVNGLLLP